MHVSGRCGSVPPCESKVAASRTDADILNYKIKNTVRRSDGMSVRERERERKENRKRQSTVLSNSCSVSTVVAVRRRSSSASVIEYIPQSSWFKSYIFSRGTYSIDGDSKGVDTLDDDDDATTSRQSHRHWCLALPFYQVLTWRLRSHTYIHAPRLVARVCECTRVYVCVCVRVYGTPTHTTISLVRRAAHDVQRRVRSLAQCFHFLRITVSHRTTILYKIRCWQTTRARDNSYPATVAHYRWCYCYCRRCC